MGILLRSKAPKYSINQLASSNEVLKDNNNNNQSSNYINNSNNLRRCRSNTLMFFKDTLKHMEQHSKSACKSISMDSQSLVSKRSRSLPYHSSSSSSSLLLQYDVRTLQSGGQFQSTNRLLLPEGYDTTAKKYGEWQLQQIEDYFDKETILEEDRLFYDRPSSRSVTPNSSTMSGFSNDPPESTISTTSCTTTISLQDLSLPQECMNKVDYELGLLKKTKFKRFFVRKKNQLLQRYRKLH